MTRLDDRKTEADVSFRTGLRFVLARSESVVKYKPSDDGIQLLVQCDVVKETRTRITVVKRGKRLITWARTDEGWVRDTDMSTWDDSFVPEITVKFGRVESPKEYHDRRKWEGMAYRPGTAMTPLDSCDRATEGGDIWTGETTVKTEYPETMRGYWA